jgi:hypothetical protein
MPSVVPAPLGQFRSLVIVQFLRVEVPKRGMRKCPVAGPSNRPPIARDVVAISWWTRPANHWGLVSTSDMRWPERRLAFRPSLRVVIGLGLLWRENMPGLSRNDVLLQDRLSARPQEDRTLLVEVRSFVSPRPIDPALGIGRVDFVRAHTHNRLWPRPRASLQPNHGGHCWPQVPNCGFNHVVRDRCYGCRLAGRRSPFTEPVDRAESSLNAFRQHLVRNGPTKHPLDPVDLPVDVRSRPSLLHHRVLNRSECQWPKVLGACVRLKAPDGTQGLPDRVDPGRRLAVLHVVFRHVRPIRKRQLRARQQRCRDVAGLGRRQVIIARDPLGDQPAVLRAGFWGVEFAKIIKPSTDANDGLATRFVGAKGRYSRRARRLAHGDISSENRVRYTILKGQVAAPTTTVGYAK